MTTDQLAREATPSGGAERAPGRFSSESIREFLIATPWW